MDGSTAITPLRFLALLLVVSGVVPATACIGSERYLPRQPYSPPRNGHQRIPYSAVLRLGFNTGHIRVTARGSHRFRGCAGNLPTAELVALLWYWPQSWTRRHLREARIFTGGVAPAGYNVKILWTFLAPLARSQAGRNLVVQGHQLDGSATFRQQPFSRISSPGQRGAPSYASIINVPHPGCWRLDLKSRGLSGHIQFRAVSGRG